MGSGKIEPTEILAQRPLLMERFEVITILGEGAAGAVYKVKDRNRGDAVVALKVLVNQSAFDEHTKKRFKEEWLISSKLVHKNIVTAYELIELDDAIAYTMEFVQGRELSEVLGLAHRDLHWVDRVFSQLLEALQFLHKNGVFHRDIKLENILVDREGTLKLSDLGLMKINRQDKLTKTGVLLGTAQYMPPEYIRSGQYGISSEVYAVGVVLYEVLSRKRWMAELSGNEAIEKLIKINFTFPKLTTNEIPKKYHYILQRSLNPEPDQRFQTVKRMQEAFAKSVEYYEQDKHVKDFEKDFQSLEAHIDTPRSTGGSALSNRTSMFHLVAGMALCMVLITVGTALFRSGYLHSQIVPSEKTYQAVYLNSNGTVSEKMTVQVGTAGALLLSKQFCPQGFLSFTDTTLQCDATSYRAVILENESDYTIKLYSGFSLKGKLILQR